MKRFLAILGILIVLFVGGVWFFVFRGKKHVDHGPKPKPIMGSKHSPSFNQNIDSALTAYYNMTEGFVNWDTATVNKYATEFKVILTHFRADELKKDTAKDADLLYQTALDYVANSTSEASNILQGATIDKKRESLTPLTDNLATLLRTIRYDQAKIYYQECPMAFNDEIAGYWLSRTDAVRNPYLGNQHPKYRATMVECGSPKDTLNFIPIAGDTTQGK
jgi:hypothetical protein